MFDDGTIAAISTAHGTGGIGIIRVSGAKAFEIAGRIFKGKKSVQEQKSHSINYGRVIDPRTGSTLDEVLLSKMEAPNTFTREDTVEINCHGGLVVLGKVLDLVISQGARPAEPGEFTRRAFLNGRIDLSQAEAVIDLINSKTTESSKAALEQLEGRLSKRLKEARSKLIELIAHIDVTVDYPEHDIEEITARHVYEEAVNIQARLEEITRNFEKGRIIREGLEVVIAGKPNVGKSSLLNELTGKNRAIVTDVPGTTRDIIEEYININGIPVRIIDTAGIRETEDMVEKIGVERTGKAIEAADLVIMMLDASEGIGSEDLKILEKIRKKKHIILLNKMDLVRESPDVEFLKAQGRKVIELSIKEDFGMDKLEEEITGMFMAGDIRSNDEILLTNIRHKALVDKASDSIGEALKAIDGGMPLDLVTIDIKNAAGYLGEITGESVSEDVMNEIFSRFCLGK